jgi:hypothetical protein
LTALAAENELGRGAGYDQEKDKDVIALRERFPAKDDLLRVFGVCVLVTFSWLLVWFLYELPSWLAFLDFWSIVGILAYALVASLLESVVLLLFVLALAIVLPRKWLRDRFATQGALIVLVLAFWLGLVQWLSSMRLWSDAQIVLGLVLVVATMVVASILAVRSPRLGAAVRSLAERSTILLYLYLPLGVLSLVIVLIRNVT